MNKPAHLCLLLASVVAVALPRAALADGTRTDKQRADALFDEAKVLMQEQRYVEACPKFAASNAIDPGVGGFLWQGECEERANQPAAAWQSFSAAETMANARGDARASVAHDRREKIEPLVARITVDASDVEGANVLLDGHDMAAIDTAIEPGAHTFVVKRTDGATWSTSIVAHAGERAALHPIFVLDRAAPDGPVAVAALEPSSRSASEAKASTAAPVRTGDPVGMGIGIGGAAAGLVGLGAGLYLGAEARSTYDAAQTSGHCSASNQCDAEGISSRNHASMLARDATVFVAAGAGVAAIGTIVAIKWWNVRIVPTAGRSSAGLTTVGTF